jgi:ferrous iron transport protein A
LFEVFRLCIKDVKVMSKNVITTLENLASNTKFKVVDINAGYGLKQRLLQMGFVPGVEGVVVSNMKGHVVVYIRNSQISISRGIAQRIHVEVL